MRERYRCGLPERVKEDGDELFEMEEVWVGREEGRNILMVRDKLNN